MKIRILRRNPFHFTTPRQRLAILAAAVCTAAGLGVALLLPHARFLQAKRAPPAPCAPGQTGACVGAAIEVMLLAPAPAAASAAR